MSIAIRYFSKFGHTKKMVGIIQELTGVTPETVAVPLKDLSTLSTWVQACFWAK